MKFLVAIAVMLCCSIGHGGIVIDNSNPFNVDEISQFQTTGSDMAGLSVTAYFADGSSDQAIWQSLSVNSGGALGNGWSLKQTGDTFEIGKSREWKLKSNSNVVGLGLNGAVGGVVFDRRAKWEVSRGSARGREIISDYDFDATYSQPVLVDNTLHNDHDLYGKLDIDFAPTRKFSFLADTDNIASVPEPSALGLLVGLLFYRRKRLTS